MRFTDCQTFSQASPMVCSCGQSHIATCQPGRPGASCLLVWKHAGGVAGWLSSLGHCRLPGFSLVLLHLQGGASFLFLLLLLLLLLPLLPPPSSSSSSLRLLLTQTSAAKANCEA